MNNNNEKNEEKKSRENKKKNQFMKPYCECRVNSTVFILNVLKSKQNNKYNKIWFSNKFVIEKHNEKLNTELMTANDMMGGGGFN